MEASFLGSPKAQRELTEILALIDAELASERDAAGTADSAPASSRACGELRARIDALAATRAPLYLPDGRDWRSQFKRLLNVPLRIFGRRQAHFNGLVVESLELLLSELRAVRYRGEVLARLPAQMERLHHDLRALTAEIETLREQHDRVRARLDDLAATDVRLAGTLAEHASRFGDLDIAHGNERAERHRLDELLRGQAAWIGVLQRKHESLALETRELTDETRPRAESLPEPRIPDPERYRERLAGMGDHVKVNLGCGEQPWADYINVDARELPDVDVVADARRLPFEPDSITELASAHLVEHFREYHLRSRVLGYWKSLLSPRGFLRIICPDWGAMLARVQDGRMDIADFKLVTFGRQDYEGDDHFAMYTADTLSALLHDCGFPRVEVVATDRMNDICPELELLAYVTA